MIDDYSRNEECLNWLKMEYIMLGRSIYSFLLGIESNNPTLLHMDECGYHLCNVISRLTTVYKIVSALNPEEKIVFEPGLSMRDLFEKNKLGLMTVSGSLEYIEKPILTANQDFHPSGYPYPFSSWFHEKTYYLAESFIFIAGFAFDHDRKIFDEESLTSLSLATKILRELLCFLERKYYCIFNDYSGSPFSIEAFFVHYGFGHEIMQFNPDSEYWKEMKAKKGVGRFLKKWDSYVSIPREKGGRTLLYKAFENLGFKDIRIGELRRNLDKVSLGEKRWEDFLAESTAVIRQLQEEPYAPWYYGFDSLQEQIEAERRERMLY